MKNNLVTTISIGMLLLLQACGGCNSEKVNNNNKQEVPKASEKNVGIKNLNISILLDLSDRIDPKKHPSPSMEYYKRDLGYIESITKGFEKHLLSKPLNRINDQIQVYFEPEPLDPEINNLAKELKMSFTKASVTKEAIANITPQFTSVSQKIYEQAIKDKKYLGSDIWGFFKNRVKDYCIKADHRNILFILTDGYMYHNDSKFLEQNRSSYLTSNLIKSSKLNTSKYNELMQKNGYGFVKANDDLADLEIVVVGINPAKGNPFEGDVIDTYWVNWLHDMKTKEPVMKPFSAVLPSNLDPIIQKYINN